MRDSLAIDENDVVRYLRQHPHFFEDHPNLLKNLHLKHDSGDAVSLIERQNHILRKENTALIDRLNTFIQVAQRNDKLFLNLQALVLDLLGCTTVNALCEQLQSGLLQRFTVDAVQVVLLERVAGDGDHWLHGDAETLATHFPGIIREQRNVCGEFNADAREMLFASEPVASLALGPIVHDDRTIGVLALGSHSASHFRSGTDTLFLGHLAKVVSQLLKAL